MATFTIVTCTYNAAGTLAATLESVAWQTEQPLEHIVMDGASPDGTAEIARAFKERHRAGYLRVVSEPDKGLYHAMNKGLEEARGDYLVFLNAGDTLPSPGTLATLSALAEDSGTPGVLYGNTDIVDASGKFVRHRRLSPPARLTWKSFRQGMLVCHQAFYARTDIACSTPYDTRYRFSADFDWCVRVLKKAGSATGTEAVVANYLEEGLTTQNHRKSLAERFRIMCRHYGIATTAAMHLWFAIRR